MTDVSPVQQKIEIKLRERSISYDHLYMTDDGRCQIEVYHRRFDKLKDQLEAAGFWDIQGSKTKSYREEEGGEQVWNWMSIAHFGFGEQPAEYVRIKPNAKLPEEPTDFAILKHLKDSQAIGRVQRYNGNFVDTLKFVRWQYEALVYEAEWHFPHDELETVDTDALSRQEPEKKEIRQESPTLTANDWYLLGHLTGPLLSGWSRSDKPETSASAHRLEAAGYLNLHYRSVSWEEYSISDIGREAFKAYHDQQQAGDDDPVIGAVDADTRLNILKSSEPSGAMPPGDYDMRVLRLLLDDDMYLRRREDGDGRLDRLVNAGFLANDLPIDDTLYLPTKKAYEHFNIALPQRLIPSESDLLRARVLELESKVKELEGRPENGRQVDTAIADFDAAWRAFEANPSIENASLAAVAAMRDQAQQTENENEILRDRLATMRGLLMSALRVQDLRPGVEVAALQRLIDRELEMDRIKTDAITGHAREIAVLKDQLGIFARADAYGFIIRLDDAPRHVSNAKALVNGANHG